MTDRYLVVDSGPGVSIHKATIRGIGFETLAQAHDFIWFQNLRRVQVIARSSDGTRRALRHDEQVELDRICAVGSR